MTRQCKTCGEVKAIDMFHKNKPSVGGLLRSCKTCINGSTKGYERTREGLITKIYGGQRERSRVRGHPMPSYTLDELKSFTYSQPNFESLYNQWVESGCKKSLIPSFDRLDDYKGYTFDNIRLTTWADNKKRAYEDRKNGINTMIARAINQFTLSGELVQEHYSINNAGRITGVDIGNIWKAITGRYKTAGGFTWQYADHAKSTKPIEEHNKSSSINPAK